MFLKKMYAIIAIAIVAIIVILGIYYITRPSPFIGKFGDTVITSTGYGKINIWTPWSAVNPGTVSGNTIIVDFPSDRGLKGTFKNNAIYWANNTVWAKNTVQV